jgi:hypothetical protein
MQSPVRSLLDSGPYFRSRFHALCVAAFYIGMAMLAASLLEAYGVWEEVARMLP